MRYGAEHKQETRKRVVKAAADAIRAEGPHRIGVAGVMANAGLTHGGFYAHFASKDDLVLAAMEQMFAEGGRRLAREAETRSPLQALDAYIGFYLSAAHRDTRSGGCPIPFLSADAPRLPTAAQTRFADGVDALMDKIARQMEAAGLPEPDALAASVMAELVGALSLARAVTDPDRSDAILTRSRNALRRRLGLEEPAHD